MQASLAPSLYAETARARNTILGASFCVACVLVVLALQTVDNSHSAVSLSIFTILMSGFTAWRRFRYHGVEPLALFCLAFALYDGLLLFRLATLGDGSVLLYPATFSDETYAAAGVLCAIAAGAILFTAILWENISVRRGHRRQSPGPSSGTTTGWFWSGILMYATGVVLYYLQFQQFGGYFVALATQRGERFELAGDPSALSYPYLAFVIPGIACMCYGSESNRKLGQRIICYGLIAFWCLLVLLQGDRRLLLQAVLATVGVLTVLRRNFLRLRVRTWVLIALAYLAFSVYGYARTLVTNVAGGLQTPDEAFQELTNTWTSDWIMPEHTEFAGPYLSLLSAVSVHTEHIYGSSYYDSFLTVLPRFLYPGVKPQVLSEGFAEQVHRGNGSVTGWGYNPVAEAYVNFGTIGVVLIFVLWSLFFLAVGALRSCGTWGVLTSAALLSEGITANRIDFRNVYWETTYFVAGVMLATCIAATINKIWSKPRRHVDNWIQ
jgi:O-antigen polysaccharide polymerase Wzy